MKISNSYFGSTKKGRNQKFTCYHLNNTGKYVTRFVVNNYIPNGSKHNNWCGKGCSSFKTLHEAVSFGYKICRALDKINDVHQIKNVVELHNKYEKTFA